jgi:hypothetical protein
MENNTPLSSLEPSLQPTQPDRLLKNIVLGLSGLLLLVSVGVGGYYLGMQQSEQTSVEQTPQRLSQLETSPMPEVSPTATAVLRLFDPSKPWIKDHLYPKVLMTSDENLKAIQCTPFYTADNSFVDQVAYVNYMDSGEKQLLTDATHMQRMELVTTTTGKRVDTYFACTTSEGAAWVVTTQEGGGGGSNSVADIGVINGGTYNQIGSIANPGIAYFRCHAPLQLTIPDQFFIKCGGGDGGGSGEAIYQIDGMEEKVVRIEMCTLSLAQLKCE